MIYPYLPLATNAPMTTFFWGGDFIKNSVCKNSYNNCSQMSFFLSEYTKIDVGLGFPHTPLGNLTALSRPLAGFKETASRNEGSGGKN